MDYTVILRDNQTGEERRIVEKDYDYDKETAIFFWDEGNGSCDCNRGAAFAEAGGEPDPDLPCDGDRIELVAILWDDGTEFRLEYDDAETLASIPVPANDHASGGFEVIVTYASSLPPPTLAELEQIRSTLRRTEAEARRYEMRLVGTKPVDTRP